MTEPEQEGLDLSDALLDLYECSANNQHFTIFVRALDGLLLHDREETELTDLEKHSGAVWRKAQEMRAYLPDHTTTDLPRFVLTSFNRVADGYDISDYLDLRDTFEPGDHTRLREWMKDVFASGETLVRSIDETRSQLHLVKRVSEGFELYTLEGTLNDAAEHLIRESFAVTPSEMRTLKLLIEGRTLKEIAEDLDRGHETIRSQIKSIGQKFGVSRQQEIVQTVGSIQGHARETGTDTNDAGLLDRELNLPDGRKLFYQQIGDPSGVPVLFFHDFYGGRHWPEVSQRMFALRGIRLLSVSRAGFGASTVRELHSAPLIDSHVADYFALVEHLELEKAVLFSIGTGMVLAYAFALEYPERTSLVTALNPYPPIRKRKDAMSYAPGMFRAAALALLYAPNAARLISKFGTKRVNWARNIDELDRVTNVRAEGNAKAFEQDYFENFLAPNFRDLAQAKGEGTWRDVSFLAQNWAKIGEPVNTRPRTHILYHQDFPVVSEEHVEEFSDKIEAEFAILDPPFRQVHRHLNPICDRLLETA